ncbi:MAG TPA: tetratricopeptide repeat protein [Stellaceae bacterium]|jgi:tetratricopeptide (TPR) repeat protein|nr:tetratricopeptide repeat protein [Stellaceae bacterium]
MAISRRDPSARARTLYERRVTPQRAKEMLGLLDEAVAETAALVATTILCEYLNRWNDAGPAEVAKAEIAVEQALAANSRLFLAHYARGFLCRTRGEHQASLEAFDETIKCAPEFARAYAQKGEELVYLGRFDEGIAQVERAIELSPNSAVRGYFYWVIGRARFFMEQNAEAVPWLRSSVRNWSNVWYNRAYLVSAHALQGERAAASRVLRAFNQQFPGYTLAHIIENETATPDDHPAVVAGRERLHDGLRLAGMRAEAE